MDSDIDFLALLPLWCSYRQLLLLSMRFRVRFPGKKIFRNVTSGISQLESGICICVQFMAQICLYLHDEKTSRRNQHVLRNIKAVVTYLYLNLVNLVDCGSFTVNRTVSQQWQCLRITNLY